MARSPLTKAALRHFDGVLREQRAALAVELSRQNDSLEDLRRARSDASADDEHDPEGPTLSAEWSRVFGVHSELAAQVGAIDRALRRIADGNYGLCARRGESIGRARLDARPAAELCIDCARELEVTGGA